MKALITVLSLAFLASCNSKPQNDAATPALNSPDSSASKTATAAVEPAYKPVSAVPMPDPNTKTVYKIVIKTKGVPGDIDSATIANLPDPMRGAAAFYATLGGTLCTSKTCELTTALGLGNQGSPQHKAIIKQYFPTDSRAANAIAQDCYVSPSTSSNFLDYIYLTFTLHQNKFTVDYDLFHFSRHGSSTIKGEDIYEFKDNVFNLVKSSR